MADVAAPSITKRQILISSCIPQITSIFAFSNSSSPSHPHSPKPSSTSPTYQSRRGWGDQGWHCCHRHDRRQQDPQYSPSLQVLLPVHHGGGPRHRSEGRHNVLEAARKFLFSLDVIEKKALQAITNPQDPCSGPGASAAMFCDSCRGRQHLREETLLAAKSTLTQLLVPLCLQEIDLLSLINYHWQCSEAVCLLRLRLNLNISWITFSDLL